MIKEGREEQGGKVMLKEGQGGSGWNNKGGAEGSRVE
jgi:hypothetical protein